MEQPAVQHNMKAWLIFSVLLLLLVAVGLLAYLAYQQKQNILSLQEDRNLFLLELATSTKQLAAATSTIATLEARLAELDDEKIDLQSELVGEKGRNQEFQNQIDRITGTVADLDKLAKTDKELLQKYSKVFFLSEHYVPAKLKQIDSKYIMPGRSDQYFETDALPYLIQLLDAAADDDIDLKVISAYRSFDQQAELKGAYTQIYGSGANTFSADQGYSEHQLGTTLDMTDTKTGGPYLAFENTEAFTWLEKNAYKYGFVMSYPKDNDYYVYEPWHWRFVGKKLARDLHRDGANFYDWDQRDINEYLINIFD